MRRHASWMRGLAALFLLAIFADVALDAKCDPLPTVSDAGSAFSARGSAANERRAPGCVPDCFCCSRSLAVGLAVPPPVLGSLAAAPLLKPLPAPAGVRPVPYHPPLILA